MDVAIIGGGPCGLITLDALIKENMGFNIKLFERRDKIGGCWNVTPPGKISFIKQNPIDELPKIIPSKVPKSKINRHMDTAAYDYLETNVEATAMEFSIEKFPNNFKSRQGPEFRHHKDILNWMETNFAKYEYIYLNTSLELIEKIGNKFRLILRNFNKFDDYIYEEYFDKIVIATGHFDVPYIPNIIGLEQFKGTLIHSKHFRDRNLFKDKKTIVVGSSVSAMDSIRDILSVVKLPALTSQRSNDHVYFGNDAFKHKDIIIKPEIVKIENNKVYYKDGNIEENVDAILLATGYLYDYPFLKQVPDLFEMIFNINDPSMAFVGAITPGLTFKLFEWQAVLVAKSFAGRSNLPKKLIKNRQEVGYDFKTYFETLRELAGESKIGRILPEFDEEWERCFYRGHEFRKNMWR
ncbi:unnamed protein product [Candida verbasci]|uniref:Flavin-containing monooxygenase n=1 Tax=Candida verbasci TaxID=1227364 RepID=A0A9W4TXZ1_9ASCO|nr:unnamed protein product [Candida verbasci]